MRPLSYNTQRQTANPPIKRDTVIAIPDSHMLVSLCQLFANMRALYLQVIEQQRTMDGPYKPQLNALLAARQKELFTDMTTLIHTIQNMGFDLHAHITESGSVATITKQVHPVLNWEERIKRLIYDHEAIAAHITNLQPSMSLLENGKYTTTLNQIHMRCDEMVWFLRSYLD